MRPFRWWWFATPEGRSRWRRLTRRCLAACLEALAAGHAPSGGRPHAYRMKTASYCLSLSQLWQEGPLLCWLDLLHRRTQGFLRALAGAPAAAAPTPQTLGLELAALLGLGFLPRASAAGAWGLAASETATFLRLVAAASASDSPLPPGTHRTYLRLLAVPVLWSLCSTVPDPEAPLTRVERLQCGWSVAEVFRALDRLVDSPPSLYFAAGAFAAVSGPPSARRWIVRARGKAREQGARRLASFFDRLVTPGRPGPSGE